MNSLEKISPHSNIRVPTIELWADGKCTLAKLSGIANTGFFSGSDLKIRKKKIRAYWHMCCRGILREVNRLQTPAILTYYCNYSDLKFAEFAIKHYGFKKTITCSSTIHLGNPNFILYLNCKPDQELKNPYEKLATKSEIRHLKKVSKIMKSASLSRDFILPFSYRVKLGPVSTNLNVKDIEKHNAGYVRFSFGNPTFSYSP